MLEHRVNRSPTAFHKYIQSNGCDCATIVSYAQKLAESDAENLIPYVQHIVDHLYQFLHLIDSKDVTVHYRLLNAYKTIWIKLRMIMPRKYASLNHATRLSKTAHQTRKYDNQQVPAAHRCRNRFPGNDPSYAEGQLHGGTNSRESRGNTARQCRPEDIQVMPMTTQREYRFIGHFPFADVPRSWRSC